MVRSFEEEVKALEDYGHDCCARIDDRIHECCARIREAHESEVGGYQIALRWKESCDGVDTGGRDEAGSVGTDASSTQCACSGRCGGLSEEVAPITTELREHLAGFKPVETSGSIVVSRIGTIGYEKAMQLCDAIDAVHASLERENDELQRRTKYPAETERINMLEREVKQLTSECKTQRNNFDQATSAREHWKSLYEQSLEQIHDLEHDVEMWRDRAEDMRMERDDALKERHEWAPESHYMMLPKDSDGIPVHIGDVMEWPDTSTAEVVGVYENGFFYVDSEDDIAAEWTTAYNKVHHAHETVEDVLREFALAVCKDDALTIRKGVVEEFAKRLTLAGDAE